MGFFQLASDGMKNLINVLQVDNMQDLSILIALYRPGTLNAGVQNTIGRAKNDVKYGKSLWDKNVLPLIDDVVRNTYYHILYQEQVMYIGQRIGDYDMAELNDFRKFISNKSLKDADPKKYAILREKFYTAFSNGKSDYRMFWKNYGRNWRGSLLTHSFFHIQFLIPIMLFFVHTLQLTIQLNGTHHY